MANSRKLSKKAVQSELMTLATVAGGMVAGTLAVNAAEKVLKVDAGSKLPKRLIAPVAVAAGGAILSVKSTNPMIKRAAVGAGAAGVSPNGKNQHRQDPQDGVTLKNPLECSVR